MFSKSEEWLINNWIEIVGAVLGLAYIFFSIKQKIFTWPTGLLTSVLYVMVFFKSKLYAAMGLQAYYVGISFYGWYYWIKGRRKDGNQGLPVRRLSYGLLMKILPVFFIVFITILIILQNFTDSPLPWIDSFITSLSIIATWMLARKILENWLIWIFADLLSVGLYFYKELWPTVLLFSAYSFLAFIGYAEWKKSMIRHCAKD